jgi:hypothetical protein
MFANKGTRRVFVKRTISAALGVAIASTLVTSSAFAAAPTLQSIVCDKAKSANGFCGKTHVDAVVEGQGHSNPDAYAYCVAAGGKAPCDLYDNVKCAGANGKAKPGENLWCV